MSDSTAPQPEVNSLASLLAEQRVNSTALVAPYAKGQDISAWIKQFHISAKALGMNNSGSRNMQMLKYLPQDATDWLMRVADLSSTTDVKTKLESVYGIDPTVQKSLCRRRLESLQQGNRRVAEYRMNFETIVADFPENNTLSDDVLRHIFFTNMRPELRSALLGIIDPTDTWKTLASAAAIRETVLFLGNDHFLALQPTTPAMNEPTPMEVDAVQQHSKPKRKEHPMRRWTEDGQPICGFCEVVGHYSKKCPKEKAKNNKVHAIEHGEKQAPLGSTTVQYVSAISTPTHDYACIPIDDDPIYTFPGVHSISVPTSSTSTPKIKVNFGGRLVVALVDTGASLTVMRSSTADLLQLVPDSSFKITFTTANNQANSSLGMVKSSALIGELPVVLHCHVVQELAHDLIIGYPDLKALKVIIDTASNEVRIPKGLRTPVPTTPSVGSVCSIASSVSLPGLHHAYVDVNGPPNTLAFISTPQDVAMEKLLSVASGIVEFNQNGVATVKVANLNTSNIHINKGQHIASYEYLPVSPTLYPISHSSSNLSSIQSSANTTVSSAPVTTLDMSSSIGDTLSGVETATLKGLLNEYSDCFATKASSVTPLVQHHIDTGDHRPLSQPPHRVSAAENDTITGLLEEMLEQGIIRESNSPWASGVVLVKKHDGTPRFCVDYRRINNITTRDVYPLPRIDDTLHSLGNARVFSTLDLTSSYWQIELDKESIPKSAFICRNGLYEFVRMPFGLCNAPATMQRLMDSVLAGLKWQFCLVYLDDIVVFSPSFDQHIQDLRAVFDRLRNAQLSVNLKKCKFASNKISFLGYVISPEGLHTDPEKIRAVSEFPIPTNADTLRSFLGLAGYYRCFIGKFSVISAPLNNLLKKDVPWVWSPLHQQSYDTLKQSLVSAPILRFPDFSSPFELHTDGACTAGIGVILCQRDPSNNRAYAVSFASRSLSPAEKNYGVSEVEALAIVWGIKKFAHYLTATRFTVITDHQALQSLQNKHTDLRGRLGRWALSLQQHDFKIVYRPGSKNAGPDALSRYPVAPVSDGSREIICNLTTSDLVAAQLTDPFCRQIRSTSPLPPRYSNESGVLFFSSRPVLPQSLWQDTFDLLHSSSTTGHLGIGRTLQRFSRLYYFPKQKEWVNTKVNTCEVCQKVKRSHTTHGATSMVHSNPSEHPFDTIAVDSFGPLPISKSGNKYIVVVQCMFSRYVIITAVPENTDIQVVKCLSKVISEHGIFRQIFSDNGQPYSGTLLKTLCLHLSVKQKFSPAYHPQSNGLVERFMATLRNLIVAFMDLDYQQVTWDEHLNEFQLAYNSSIHDSTKFSPFSLVHGREARTLATPDFGVKLIPAQEYQQQVKQFLGRALALVQLENNKTQANNAAIFNSHRVAPNFSLGCLVLIDFPVQSSAVGKRSAKLVRSFRGPFRITKVLSPDRFDVLEIETDKNWYNIHASRMKKLPQENNNVIFS